MIRRATLADLPAIEALLLRAKRHSEYRTVKVEFERARKTVRQCISSPQGFAAVAEHDGKITGALIGLAAHYWFSSEKFASDLGFYSQRRGDGLRLLTMFKDWADSKFAQLQLGQSTDKRQGSVERLYARIGAEKAGSLYVGEKPNRLAASIRSVR